MADQFDRYLKNNTCALKRLNRMLALNERNVKQFKQRTTMIYDFFHKEYLPVYENINEYTARKVIKKLSWLYAHEREKDISRDIDILRDQLKEAHKEKPVEDKVTEVNDAAPSTTIDKETIRAIIKEELLKLMPQDDDNEE